MAKNTAQKTKIFTGKLYSEMLSNLNRDRLDDQFYCDVTIILGNGEIKAHRNILGSSSSFFDTMFKSQMNESRCGVIDLKHLKPGIVKLVMEYIYFSRIEITMENVFDVLQCADYMIFGELKGFCQEFLLTNIDGSNCLSIHSYAKRYDLENVMEKAHNFIVDNLAIIRRHKEYLELGFDDLVKLFKDRSSKTAESDVYEGIVEWIKYAIEKRKEFFPHLISLVDMKQLSSDHLDCHVTNEPLINENVSSQKQVIEAYKFHLAENKRKFNGGKIRKPDREERRADAGDRVEEVKVASSQSQQTISLQFYLIDLEGRQRNKQTATFQSSQTIGEAKDHFMRQLGFRLPNNVNPNYRKFVRRENGEALNDNLTLAQSELKNGDVLVYNASVYESNGVVYTRW